MCLMLKHCKAFQDVFKELGHLESTSVFFWVPKNNLVDLGISESAKLLDRPLHAPDLENPEKSLNVPRILSRVPRM